MTNPKHTDTSRSGELVERLRYTAEHGIFTAHDNGMQAMPDEAADRIEALEAEVERLRDDSWFDQFEEQEQLRDNAEQRLSVVEAENERLRGALTQIARLRTDLRGDFSLGSKQSDIARAALGEKQ